MDVDEFSGVLGEWLSVLGELLRKLGELLDELGGLLCESGELFGVLCSSTSGRPHFPKPYRASSPPFFICGFLFVTASS